MQGDLFFFGSSYSLWWKIFIVSLLIFFIVGILFFVVDSLDRSFTKKVSGELRVVGKQKRPAYSPKCGCREHKKFIPDIPWLLLSNGSGDGEVMVENELFEKTSLGDTFAAEWLCGKFTGNLYKVKLT